MSNNDNNNNELNYKKSLRPKEYHPMVPYCQEVFVAAGPEYVNALISHLEQTIKQEKEEGKDPSENDNGVVLETLKMVRDGGKLNDRYVMGATLFIIHSLIPVSEVIKTRVYEMFNKDSSEEDQEQ